MHMSRAVAIACLTTLKWLLWVLGALFLILALKQFFIIEAGGDPIRTTIGGVGGLVAGWLCGRLSTRFERGA